MKVSLLTVGKTDIPWVREGIDMYASRIRHYVPFDMVELQDVKRTASLPVEDLKKKEGEAILKQIAPSDCLVLLDEKGDSFRSVGFASWLQKRMAGGRNIFFVVGGAYGFSADVYSRADYKLSLSEMTFSHQIIRAIFAEQLYRAFTIINGEPYHHE